MLTLKTWVGMSVSLYTCVVSSEFRGYTGECAVHWEPTNSNSRQSVRLPLSPSDTKQALAGMPSNTTTALSCHVPGSPAKGDTGSSDPESGPTHLPAGAGPQGRAPGAAGCLLSTVRRSHLAPASGHWDVPFLLEN